MIDVEILSPVDTQKPLPESCVKRIEFIATHAPEMEQAELSGDIPKLMELIQLYESERCYALVDRMRMACGLPPVHTKQNKRKFKKIGYEQLYNSVIQQLHENRGRVSQAEIANRIGCSRSWVTEILRKLRESGIVRREGNDQYGRYVLVERSQS